MTRRSWLLMGLLAALWGASYMFIKIALHDDVPAPSIVFIRVTLGAALLTAIAAHQHALTGLRGRWRWVWAIGLVQVAAPFLLITYGEKWIPSALAGILVASAPIFVALLSPRFAASEAVHGWAIVGIAVGILGVVLLFGVDLSGQREAGARRRHGAARRARVRVRRDLGALQAAGRAARRDRRGHDGRRRAR